MNLTLSVFPAIGPATGGSAGSQRAGPDTAIGSLMASSLGRISLGFLGIGVSEISDYRLDSSQLFLARSAQITAVVGIYNRI